MGVVPPEDPRVHRDRIVEEFVAAIRRIESEIGEVRRLFAQLQSHLGRTIDVPPDPLSSGGASAAKPMDA